MPEYLLPGVYIEELGSEARLIEGVSTSTVGFLGATEHGPLKSRLIAGFDQYRRIYGEYLADSFLAYAVEGFFKNGGQRCYVGRITSENAVPARGIRLWGARTCSTGSQWKYLNVRRFLLYIEESIKNGMQWVVFEPNDENLWARVRQTVTHFLTRVWRDGALVGTRVEEAFFVKCDRTTMTQDDFDTGRLVCEIGLAPVRPAEFVIFRLALWNREFS